MKLSKKLFFSSNLFYNGLNKYLIYKHKATKKLINKLFKYKNFKKFLIKFKLFYYYCRILL